MLRLMALGFVGCVSSGCFSKPAIYPDDWAKPQPVVTRACPDIDGVFVNAGVGSDARHRSLAHILNSGPDHESIELWNKLGSSSPVPAQDPNVTIELEMTPAGLHVVAAHADGSRRDLILSVQRGCPQGLVAVDGSWGADFEEIGPFTPELSRKSIRLGRASDGALLLHEQETATDFFLFTPIFGHSEATWIRFAKAPPEYFPPAPEAP